MGLPLHVNTDDSMNVYLIQLINNKNIVIPVMNPELHYLDHIQNTSISKYTSQFAKAPRFQPNKTTNT